MEIVIRRITAVSEFVGKAAAWIIIPLTFALGYEVFARYLFNAPTTWAFDLGIILYGSYFLLASAYTLAHNAHVRGDIFYRNFSHRTQAIIDLTLYILVFFPAMLALTWVGLDFFWESFLIRETSAFSPYRRPIYPLKAAIPVSAFLLLLQGIAQCLHCVIAIRTGRWPDRGRAERRQLEEAV
jgi:TRAP-type mannitol/chloroaromatic compound transport system permease small subunit